jgi:hypothetical protein
MMRWMHMGNPENTSAVTVLSPKNSIKNEIQINFVAFYQKIIVTMCNKLLESEVLIV